jgi:signal peptidase I
MANERGSFSSPEPSYGSPVPITDRPASLNDRPGEGHALKDAFPATTNGQAIHPWTPKGKPSEIQRFIGWSCGLVLILVCGWGLLAVALYLTRHETRNMEVAGGVAALLSLGMFFFLERNLWLSRFMGLRITEKTVPWAEALFLWVFGIPGLLWRSTQNEQAEAAARAAGEAKGSRKGSQQDTQQVDSTREVIETIVFVVVLVLLLKSFVAEAFVIPTGSMAQTLWGYQKVVSCPKCGQDFPVNCSSEVDPTDGPPTHVNGCTCPNCLQPIAFANSDPDYLHAHPDHVVIPDPGWSSGDRVLVAKFVYDLLEKVPDRLDVVVFKYPGDEDHFPITGPQKNHVPMNYIKRLIGRGGETIAIHKGKIYVLTVDKGLQYDEYEKAKTDPQLASLLWQLKYTHRNDSEAERRFKQGQFLIVRKSPDTMLAMKRLVYDNDHPAKDMQDQPRWFSIDQNLWASNGGNGFLVDAADKEDTHWLRYHHLLRGFHGKPRLITDFMGYNTWEGGLHGGAPSENWASDLILECEVDVDKAEGDLVLELSKGVDRFRARWDLSSGMCTLLRVTDDRETKLDSKPTKLTRKGTYRLRFANVDDKLTVWVDGSLPFGEEGVIYTPALESGPTKENDLDRPASIGVRGAALKVNHLKLYRDTYYTVGQRPSDSDVAGIDFSDPETWRPLRNMPLLTIYVQPDHFLCMGDNSPESSDGRSWGLVPKRLMLGRALMVYYPFNRVGRIR